MEIRPYRASDKERLRYICRETAGEDFKKNKRRITGVAAIYSDYFTENEPDNIFVLSDDDGAAVGYIECSSDHRLFVKKMLTVYIPRAAKSDPFFIFTGFAYMFAYFIDGKKNRTHLHIDILPGYQRGGFGSKLISALRAELLSRGIKRLNVCVIKPDASAYGFYMKYGFKPVRKYTGFQCLGINTFGIE